MDYLDKDLRSYAVAEIDNKLRINVWMLDGDGHKEYWLGAYYSPEEASTAARKKVQLNKQIMKDLLRRKTE